MCEFTRDLQNQIATSVIVSTDAFDILGVASAHDDQENIMLDCDEDPMWG